ncbi:hypothetical protein E2320_008119 [Naja naja]|nr:hypothetical protein E2320_008119 [Naja naja]
MPKKPECSIYEYSPRKNLFPISKEIKRGDWKTESTSSTASSSSNRSSTRSLLSISSGMEGDNEENEIPDMKRTLQVDNQLSISFGRPPRIPPRVASRLSNTDNFHPPPVPPRGRDKLH